uniref:Uncharacterized protein n=1 Tax=viral metagenome TaxID=1070528 RepID=A0A6M3IW70_9ZZZZ
MPQNDPDLWKGLVAYLAAALSTVSLWAWKHTHGKISENTIAIERKADSRSLDAVLARLDLALANQRHDNQRIFDQIQQVTETHSDFAQKCVEELGKRPTRDECRMLWHKES